METGLLTMHRRIPTLRMFLTVAVAVAIAVPVALTGAYASQDDPGAGQTFSGDGSQASDEPERPGMHRYRGFIDVSARADVGTPSLIFNDQEGRGTFFDIDDSTGVVFELVWAPVDPYLTGERVDLHLDIDHPGGHDVGIGTGTGSRSDPLTFTYLEPKDGRWHALAVAEDAAAQQEYYLYVSIFRDGPPPSGYTVFDYL